MSHDLDPDLRDLLANTPKLTPADLTELGTAVRELDNDPAFIADYNKSRFIETLLQAMNTQGVTQSELARRWGKTRQYVSKVFNEDHKVNFTLESMSELACLLGLRLDVRAVNAGEEMCLLRVTSGTAATMKAPPAGANRVRTNLLERYATASTPNLPEGSWNETRLSA